MRRARFILVSVLTLWLITAGVVQAQQITWTRQFGAPGLDVALGVAVYEDSGVYVVGTTDGTFAGQTSSGGFDAFLAKLA